MAAKIMMLRMTPHTGFWETGRYHHTGRQTATNGAREGRHFGEKDE